MTESARIADQLERSLSGKAWHGPALLDTLSVISASQAHSRPIPSAHSIWEIVLHLATWTDVVLRQLEGTGYVDPPESLDWPPVDDLSEAAWTAAKAHLGTRTLRLRDAVLQLDDRHLDDRVSGRDFSVHNMLHGIVQHNLYHAGQILMLLKADSRIR